MSCYQLLKTMTKFEKRKNHRLSTERNQNVVINVENTAVNSTMCTAAACLKDPKMTSTLQLQAERVHCPINAQIGLLIANYVRELHYSFDYWRTESWHSRKSRRLLWVKSKQGRTRLIFSPTRPPAGQVDARDKNGILYGRSSSRFSVTVVGRNMKLRPVDSKMLSVLNAGEEGT